ncbi:MAG: hypothetical protein Q9227_001901 [Pyrenula ochraceoflavens]
MLSPTSTPTSSLRPSLDIQAPNAFARGTSPAPAANARRNRAALRDYYNLKNPPSGHSGRTDSIASASTIAAGPQAESRTSLDSDDHIQSALDDPTFSPDDYVQKLLETASLNKILKAESTLVSEIRTLDGERKALVYDNYSKLIRATETIGGLTGGMDSQSQVIKGQTGLGLGGLLSNTPAEGQKPTSMQAFGTLGPAVSHVADTAKVLAESRPAEKMRLSGDQRKRRREISSAQWILQTPERLKVLIDNGNNEEASKEWDKAKKIMDRWAAVKGVSELKNTCEGLMQQLPE